MQAFKSFAGKIGLLERYARDVATRSRQSDDKAGADRVSPAKTIGITDVASLAAGTLAVPLETTMSTFCRTNSATIAAARSLRPSPHRTLIATARPSIQPTARSCSTKAASCRFATEVVVGFKDPMAGGLGVCCARATSGQAAAAPPRSVMNSRRFIRSPTHPANHSVGMMRAPCLPECSQAMMVPNAKKPRIGGAEFGRNHRG
jgi:hypothetical protein